MKTEVPKKSLNNNLHKAKKLKKDEFYTQLSDIEKELKNYKKHFKNKVVYCNCDDPFESNFFKYFAFNFNSLGLKKLIATSYIGSPIVGGQLSLFEIKGLSTKNKKEPFKIEINEVKDFNHDGAVDLADVERLLKDNANIATPLLGDGDFRNEESTEILKEVDLIVTNPPFSLFREYVAQLMEHKKKFVIIGHQNAITYKEIFKLIKENKIWLGHGFKGGATHFINKHYEDYASAGDHKQGMIRVSGVVWVTNLYTTKRHEDLIFYKKYVPDEYQKYDNYDAINVNKVADIPMDYDGVMGVPITFIDKFNPDQFEIIGLIAGNIKGMAGIVSSSGKDGPYIDGKLKYGRILIRNRTSKKKS